MEIINESKFEYLGIMNGMYAFITRDCSKFDPSIKMVTKAEFRKLDGTTEYLDYRKGRLSKEDVIKRIRECNV